MRRYCGVGATAGASIGAGCGAFVALSLVGGVVETGLNIFLRRLVAGLGVVLAVFVAI